MPSLTGTCHCGAVSVTVPRRPRVVVDCTCSICRRYGTRWAYYRADQVKVEAARGALQGYTWGRGSIRFVRCGRCGCVTHWEPAGRTSERRVGVNSRNFDPGVLGEPRVRLLDGASTWKYLT